jgi:hypothetical protein
MLTTTTTINFIYKFTSCCNNLNDQQLKKKNASCDVMETIKMEAIDVGQYSMNKNYDIAMTGNNEVKIENGKVIGFTTHNVLFEFKLVVDNYP